MVEAIKLIHIEDQPGDALLVRNALINDGTIFQIYVVGSLAEFTAALVNFSPDLILASQSVPGCTSEEALEVLRQTLTKIPFIILTDGPSEAQAANMVRNGADDYIFKDRLARLPVAVCQALKKFRLEKDYLTSFNDLFSNEKLYRSLIENSADAVVILSQQGKPTYVSPSVTKVLGYSREEIMQMDLLSIMHPDDLTATTLILEKVIANPGVPIKGHTGRMLHKDGNWRWIEAMVTNCLHDPSVNGIVDNFRDITERKMAEERYRLLFETSLDGILLTNISGKVVAANRAACEIFQMTEDEMVHAGRSGMIDVGDPRLDTLLEQRERDGKATGELSLKRKDGTFFAAEISSTVFKDTFGSENTSMIIRDISGRKAADLQLFESERFTKGILSSLTSQIAVINNYGTIIAVNKAWDDFAKANEASSLERASRGSNYFQVCEKAISAGITDAEKAHSGILSVFRKQAPAFELEYSFHSPTGKRWYMMKVMHFGDDETKVVISHHNITALKATQEKLVLSESRLNQAQAIAKIGSWEADLNTSQLFCSPQTYRIFEPVPDTFIPTYQGFLKRVHRGDRKMVDSAIRNSVRDIGHHCIEHRIVTGTGVEKTVEETWQVIGGEDGTALRISGTCQEITQRKKNEEMLITSQSNLNAIIENTDAFIYSLDRDFNYITFNSLLEQSIKSLYGISIHPGYNIFEFVRASDPDGAHEWNEKYVRALNGETVKFEKEFFFNNTYTYTRFSINPMWKDNVVIGLSCYAHDITEEKQAYKKNMFQANLLDTIGQAAIATDLDGNVTFWNKAAEQIYGWNAIEALGKNIMELTPPAESTGHASEIMSVLREGQTWSGEFKVKRKNDTYFLSSVTNSPIYDQKNNITGIIGISSDITERKSLEERFDKASALARVGSYDADIVNGQILWSSMTRQIYEVESDFIPDIENTLAFFKQGADRNTITEAYHQAKEKSTPFDLELQILTAAGSLRWIRVIGQAEFEKGTCSRIYGSLQDIDKIKIAELEVLKVYEEKNVILESIGDAFFAVDQNWTINYWNSMAEKVLGKTKSQTQGKNLWAVFSDAVGSESYHKYQEAIGTNKAVHFEDYYPPLETWYEISAYPSANVLSVYFKDITQRKKTQSALEESERNYSRLFHLSPLPMWVFDLETLCFLDVNEAAINSYGYSRSEFLEMTIKEIRPQEELHKLDKVLAIENATGQKLVSQGIFTHKKKEGTLIQVDIQSNLIRYQGKPAKIVIASDMTERYDYIHAIELQNTKLREIARIQSHVVRAPLARIMGIIPMIKDIDTYTDEREIILDYLLIAANELDDAIKNISRQTDY